ncbi:MAG: S24 family peptidase [Gammaproteobacteria bacterium]
MAKKYPQLSAILKKLLFEKNMKAVDLAREVNLPQPTIHRLVTGKSTRPYKNSLQPIADYFSLSIEQLLGETESKDNPWQHNNSSNQQNIHTIPIIPWLSTQLLDSARNESKYSIVTSGNISANCFALLVHDYSMEPLFAKNSILIFDSEKQPTDRSYVLVKLKDVEKPIFRQLLIDIDKRYLKAINPDLNPSLRELTNEDSIIAVLFESRVSFNQDNIEYALEDLT